MKWSKLFKIFGEDNGFVNVAGGNIISAVIMSSFWLFIASIMESEEYGQIHYLLSIATFASILSLFGLRITVMTYLPKGEESLHRQANLLVLLSNCFIFLPLFLIIKDVPTVFLLFGISFFTMSLSESLGKKNHKKFFFTITGRSALVASLSIVLFFVLGIEGILWGYALTTLVFSYSFFKSLKGVTFQFNDLRKKFGFMMHSYLSAIFTRGSDHIDKLLIGSLFGFELLGLYHLGFQFLVLLSILPLSLSQFLIPQEASGIKQKKTVKIGLALSVVLAISAYFFLPFIISNLFPNFIEGILAAQLIVLSVIPNTANAILRSKFLGREESKPVVIGSAIRLVVLLVLLVFLGSYLGLIGFSLALLISNISQTIFLLVLSRRFKETF